tara:strand:- start:1620 stop:2114 length:495 start_codon:yes stop_codon:yes gene_type:complete
MSLKGNILRAGARKAKVSPLELKKISGSDKMVFLKESVNHVINDLLTSDKTLHDTMQKTIAESNAELSQLHPQLRRWMEKPGSFAMFFTKAIPFIVYNGYVWNLSGGTLAADVKETLEEYCAYKIGIVREKEGANNRLNRIRAGRYNVNLDNVTTKLTAIKAAN